MKKIFAIALALVMVLSMASAFAMTCGTYDWACATTTYNCGKAKVEVVPFVRSNDACATTSSFVQSNCAAAVVGERVYYAIKLTVDAGVNEEWYNEATLVVDHKNIDDTQNGTTSLGKVPVGLPTWATLVADEVDEKGGVYWFSSDGWELDKDYENTVFEGWVFKSGAKICAKLASEFVLADMMGIQGETVEVNKWLVSFYEESGDEKGDYLAFDKGTGATWENGVYVYRDNDTDKVIKVMVDVDGKHTWYVGRDANGLLKRDGGYDSETCAPGKLAAEVLDYFKLSFGTCVTDKAIAANFGWDDEIESCYEWSKNAQAVVDAECVVAIPKTGDASVLAWLF